MQRAVNADLDAEDSARLRAVDPRYPQQPPQAGWPAPAPQQPAPPPPPSYPFLAAAKANGYVPTEEEKKLAMYSHLFAAGLALICCGTIHYPIGALIPLMMTKARGPFMLFHVNQAVWFHGVNALAIFVLLTVGGILTIVCVGYVLIAIVPILQLVAVIYPIVVGIQAGNGAWTEYPVAGKRVLESVKRPVFT